jgi:probable F420-dependent oxidoreductase
MHFSLELPTQRVERPDEFVTASAIAEVTRAAGRAGFAAVNVTDHPAPDTRWLDHGGHHALDPFVALSFAAGADPAIRLLTNIYVAAYRNPFAGAKSVHSLDVLSGGRLILGVAAGYLKPEFAALGVDFETRGALLDEALEVLEAVSTGADVTWQSERSSARGVRFRPVAPSGGRPPVWVGGNSRAAMRRAARYDGWAPFHTAGFSRTSRTAAIETVDDLAPAIRHVQGLVAAQGRQDALDICWSASLTSGASLSADERRARVAALAEVGVTWMTVSIPAEDRAGLIAEIEAFGRDVISETAAS